MSRQGEPYKSKTKSAAAQRESEGNVVPVIVVKNNTLGMIKWEQMVFLGNPEIGCELQPIDFVKIAEAK